MRQIGFKLKSAFHRRTGGNTIGKPIHLNFDHLLFKKKKKEKIVIDVEFCVYFFFARLNAFLQFQNKIPYWLSFCYTTIKHNHVIIDDLRRSKQPIAVQNALYNLGSSFNQPKYELSSVKPANQYQLQKASSTTTTTTAAPPRISLIIRKSTTAATPQVTVKPTPFVLASSNYNSKFERRWYTHFIMRKHFFFFQNNHFVRLEAKL